MAKIVCVHGMSNQYLGAETIKNSWLPAINDGLKISGYPLLDPDDIDVAFYGDLFRPNVDYKGSSLDTLIDEFDEWEQQLIIELWLEAYKLSQEKKEHEEIFPVDLTGLKSRTPKLVQEGLRMLSKTWFFTNLRGENILLGALRQVKAFLLDEKLKLQILGRVEDIIGNDTQILIGHSLGSIVAYEALCKNPNWGIKTFITIGSPLGIQNVIFNNLTPAPYLQKGHNPQGLKRWVNLADEGDLVALEKKLAVYFDGVEDHLVHNGKESHDGATYLRSRIIGEVIGGTIS